MAFPELSWLPECGRERIAALGRGGGFDELLRLAGARLDFVRTQALDQILRRRWPEPPPEFDGRTLRLALLASSTTAHLAPSLRVAGLRHGLWLEVWEGEYGQYRQALDEPTSALHAFRPEAVLFAFDVAGLAARVSAADASEAVAAALAEVRGEVVALWRKARATGALVLQQALLPAAPAMMGANEHRLPGARANFVAHVNAGFRVWADEEGADLVALDAACARDGLNAWRDATLWARAKQEIKPAAAPMYGELVVRTLAARLGRSRKCLALDLDNTIWGGVIGDDGLDGVLLGQGSALGEGFLAVQEYALELSRRGIMLAVCSKNDEAHAWEPFDKHPDMALRRADIACFIANWDDKAQNLRRIAERLNIGLDSLVFLDDSPFERDRVREALPMVAVPEIPDDPALVPDALAAAGYFESVAVTADDTLRARAYADNSAREAERSSLANIGDYLQGFAMRAPWGFFDAVNRQRIVQLINKTNQFNLTTRRYSEADYDGVVQDESAVGLHLRLVDRFGDNGLIGVAIARQVGADLVIDTWLMSCRVLGRQVEVATLSLLVEQARARGAQRLLGEYVPSLKNGVVREHYERLGFTLIEEDAAGGKRLALEVLDYRAPIVPVVLEWSGRSEKTEDGVG